MNKYSRHADLVLLGQWLPLGLPNCVRFTDGFDEEAIANLTKMLVLVSALVLMHVSALLVLVTAPGMIEGKW